MSFNIHLSSSVLLLCFFPSCLPSIPSNPSLFPFSISIHLPSTLNPPALTFWIHFSSFQSLCPSLIPFFPYSLLISSSPFTYTSLSHLPSLHLILHLYSLHHLYYISCPSPLIIRLALCLPVILLLHFFLSLIFLPSLHTIDLQAGESSERISYCCSAFLPSLHQGPSLPANPSLYIFFCPPEHLVSLSLTRFLFLRLKTNLLRSLLSISIETVSWYSALLPTLSHFSFSPLLSFSFSVIQWEYNCIIIIRPRLLASAAAAVKREREK